MAIPELENGYRVQDEDWNEIVDAVNATAPIKALTQTEYDALSTSEKNNGTVYLIQGGGIAYNDTRYAPGTLTATLGSNQRATITFSSSSSGSYAIGILFARGSFRYANLTLFFNSYGATTSRTELAELTKGQFISYSVDSSSQALILENTANGQVVIGVFMLYGSYPTITTEAIE